MKTAISAIALAVALSFGSYGGAEAAGCKVGVSMYTLARSRARFPPIAKNSRRERHRP